MSCEAGYDARLIHELPDYLVCSLCNKIIREAIQTNRGLKACKNCYEMALLKCDGKCPLDNSMNTTISIDKSTDEQVNKLLVFCTSRDCEWSGCLKDLKNHTEHCELNSLASRSLSIDEDSSSTQLLNDCPWNCGQAITPETITDHVFQCSKTTTTNGCPFEALGCAYKDSEPIADHLLHNTIVHAQMLIPHILRNSMSSTNLEKSVVQQDSNVTEMKGRIEIESTKNILLSNEVSHLKGELESANKKIDTLEKDISGVRSAFEYIVKEMNTLKQKPSIEQRIRKLEENSRKTSTESDNLNKALDDSNTKITNFENKFNGVQSSLSDLDLRYQILENTSIGGRFVWKIDRLKFRIKQAVNGQVMALHSAPCFTTKFGYKFCTRIYLNGDGVGKNTHVSLFIVIMRSDYDALLQWPFRQKVTFKLINHANQNDSLKESFIPDSSSPSFKRPQREMNLAAGCPMFITKERLEKESFVFDDSIFIETVVADA